MKLDGSQRKRFFYIGIGSILLLAIVIGFQRHQSQNQFTPTHVDETKTISLEKSSNARQLILFENERIIISVGHDQYLSHAKSDVKLPTFSDIVESHSAEIEPLFDRGILPKGFYDQSAFVVEMLNSGKASVYDKQAGKELTNITVRYQNDIFCPVCGGGSISFYFPDGTLLYKGPEWNY